MNAFYTASPNEGPSKQLNDKEYLNLIKPNKIYLVLLKNFNESEEEDDLDGHYKFIKGKLNTAIYIADLLRDKDSDSIEFDIEESFVCADDFTLQNRKSLVKFFIHCQDIYPQIRDVDIESLLEYDDNNEDEISQQQEQATGNMNSGLYLRKDN